ncbi:hypothetical protein [Hibiscus bacilliform virus GD1]|uniref:hypothetical protein n=1 Tax=Hibiscus bacilliform virus GD1 TaxID=1459800 RepID=UPI0003EFD4C0|nr:hypothetical protein [Hibiscus bacilliform virus GD1]AHI90955.1 hypothetical protein [Hibiscus bacilliform virus GD1]
MAGRINKNAASDTANRRALQIRGIGEEAPSTERDTHRLDNFYHELMDREITLLHTEGSIAVRYKDHIHQQMAIIERQACAQTEQALKQLERIQRQKEDYIWQSATRDNWASDRLPSTIARNNALSSRIEGIKGLINDIKRTPL